MNEAIKHGISNTCKIKIEGLNLVEQEARENNNMITVSKLLLTISECLCLCPHTFTIPPFSDPPFAHFCQSHSAHWLNCSRGLIIRWERADPETPGGIISEEALKEKKDILHGRVSVDIRGSSRGGSRRSLASSTPSQRGPTAFDMQPASSRTLPTVCC